MNNNMIPVFFSIDDNYVPCFCVAMQSLVEHTSPENYYKIHILHKTLTNENKEIIKSYETENISVEFCSLEGIVKKIDSALKLRLRDYYSDTIYYRLFIQLLYPHYDKAIYLDADMIIQTDIAELYNMNIGDNLLATVRDEVVNGNETFKEYSKVALGLDPEDYFNSGMLLMNLKGMREISIEEKFLYMLTKYNLDTIAPDQDYLNILCKGRTYKLPEIWDKMPDFENKYKDNELKIIHYNMFRKPWHYEDVPHSNVFWKYAKKTQFYDVLQKELKAYTKKQKEDDLKGAVKLEAQAQGIIDEDLHMQDIVADLDKRFANLKFKYKIRKIYMKKDKQRLRVIDNIKKSVKEGKFDNKVEEGDHVVTPEEREGVVMHFDNLHKGVVKKTKRWLARSLANGYTYWINGDTIIEGLENAKNLNSGAIITSNHFNVEDSTIIRKMVNKAKKKKHFNIVIEEENVFMTGQFGFLMKNCDTLLLSPSNEYMAQNFLPAIEKCLKRKDYILIYPEEQMWFNYKKPRPLKPGAYHLACKYDVPIIPCFVELKEKDNEYNSNGFKKLQYILHVMQPLYPNQDLPLKDRKEDLRKRDYKLKVECYERAYGKKLDYKFEDDDIAGY